MLIWFFWFYCCICVYLTSCFAWAIGDVVFVILLVVFFLCFGLLGDGGLFSLLIWCLLFGVCFDMILVVSVVVCLRWLVLIYFKLFIVLFGCWWLVLLYGVYCFTGGWWCCFLYIWLVLLDLLFLCLRVWVCFGCCLLGLVVRVVLVLAC